MRKKQMVSCVVAVILLLFLAALPVAAADGGVPGAVLNAKSGVLRILNISEYGIFTGTGFAVGSGNRVYIATNYHVVEDAEVLFVFYDTGKYVTAQVQYEDISRDLCVLKPDDPVPDVEILPVFTGEIESGIGVYALGYPAAADYFTMDMEEEYEDEEEFLASVTADKQSMTITDGIVSALHESPLIGDGSRDVEMLQTNTALNGGNSGGPLLNGAGQVVGVNTMGLSDAQAMNGAVHASELVRVLRAAGVDFEESARNAPKAEAVPEKTNENLPLVIILSAMGLVLVGGAVAAGFVVRRQKKMPVKGGLALVDFEKSYRRVEEVASLEMSLRFVNELLPMAQYNLMPLLTPDNVIVGDTTIVLKEKNVRAVVGVATAVPGYVAPEVLSGRTGPAAPVYFVGAMLYTLLTGTHPPDARRRLATGEEAFPESTGPVRALVNRAMQPYQQNRIPDLYRLAQDMQQTLVALGQRPGY